MEVLGLMKAQITKNSVIAPVGSKGGFIVKNMCDTKEDTLKNTIECYKTFLKGILDITDNLVDGKIVHPQDVIRYDGEDPYLVVAADKGTASFSDIANSVSKEYNFWLGDAFASGGSVGYDHKKMGITSRGAWVSVEQHMVKLGINVHKDVFSVVGIGDMAGDVFGNGMLYSNKIKLIAAFNHIHIFLDPDPDPEKSFKERQRLFSKEHSSWSDYDTSIISKGGMVVQRSLKNVTLSTEIQKALDFDKSEVSPDELIRAILKSPVDLLWNGGIGTYVKSSKESNEEANDKGNDNVRINGEDLRCKVVGEGGNLGFTQLGRIEYVLSKSGLINTDSIDNSAGVNCSDHEVNIKIALSQAHDLSEKKRQELLEDMTNEVAQLVLRSNKVHSQSITIMRSTSHIYLDQYQKFMHALEYDGILNRDIEYLPSDEELELRKSTSVGLTRPELSVLLSYGKIDIYEKLLGQDLLNDKFLEKYLIEYFPSQLRSRFEREILSHRLRQNIIANHITNSFVNRMGGYLFRNLIEDYGYQELEILKAYVVVIELFDLEDIWRKIDDIQFDIDNQMFMDVSFKIQKFIQHNMLWLLNNQHVIDISELISNLKSEVMQIVANSQNILDGVTAKRFSNKVSTYVNDGIPENLAVQITTIEFMALILDIVKIYDINKKEIPIIRIGEILYQINRQLCIDHIHSLMNNINRSSYWDSIALNLMKNNLHKQSVRLTQEIIDKHYRRENVSCVDSWVENNHEQILAYNQLLGKMELLGDDINIQVVIVIIQRIESLVV